MQFGGTFAYPGIYVHGLALFYLLTFPGRTYSSVSDEAFSGQRQDHIHGTNTISIQIRHMRTQARSQGQLLHPQLVFYADGK